MFKKSALTAILALMACGAAQAATVGNIASVTAPVTITASNTTSATWSPDSNFVGPTFTQGQKIGTLSVTATGAHSEILISGKDTSQSSGVVNIPFYDDSGNVSFRGRILSPAKDIKTSVNGMPGWSIADTAEHVDISVVSLGTPANVAPGTHTATFYIQQFQN